MDKLVSLMERNPKLSEAVEKNPNPMLYAKNLRMTSISPRCLLLLKDTIISIRLSSETASSRISKNSKLILCTKKKKKRFCKIPIEFQLESIENNSNPIQNSNIHVATLKQRVDCLP